MYKAYKIQKTSLKINQSYKGETLETKIKRMMNNKEPLDADQSPLIYTDRKDGVQAAYDIRTDRFEIAVDAMDKVTASKLAKRDMLIQERTYDTMNEEQRQKFHEKYPNSKIRPIQTTTDNKGGA